MSIKIARMIFSEFGWKSLVYLTYSNIIVNEYGFVIFCDRGGYIEIILMMIVKPKRNMGLGSKLLQEIIDMDKPICVRTKSARRFYTKHGFDSIGTSGGVIRKKAFIMHRRVK